VSRFDLTLDPERVARRIEVINGTGGRRRWPADDKARILEETLAPGAVVSEIARRYGLRPQQVFGWRREARIAPGEDCPSFVPAVVKAAAPVPKPAAVAAHQPAKRRRRATARAGAGIEVEIDGVMVRIGPDASAKTIAAVIGALKATR
jgi:transposase